MKLSITNTNITNTNTTSNMENQKYCEFIRGFANGLDVDYSEAREQWASFSRLLTDSERENDEEQGEDRGYELGEEARGLDYGCE